MADAPPLDALARTAVLYGFGLTVWLGASAVRRRPVEVYARAAAVLFWLATTVVAIAHAVAVLRDGAGHEVAVSLAYAVAAAVVMPVLWIRDEADDARIPALATAVTVVLVVRLGAVW